MTPAMTHGIKLRVENAGAERHAVDARHHLERGDINAAESLAIFALALQSSNALAKLVLASVMRRRGQYAEAEKQLRAFFENHELETEARIELAKCLADQGDFLQAIKTLEMVEPHNDKTFFELAVLHDLNADASSAIELVQQALRLNPAHFGAQFLLARCFVALGDVERAAATYRLLTKRRAHAPKAWFALLDLKVVRISNPELQALEKLAKDKTCTAHEQTMIGFALGNAYEQSGRFEKAVSTFHKANSMQREKSRWNAEAHTRLMNETVKAFHNKSTSEENRLGAEVIFVLGAPRSGTTWAEQILSAHPEVIGASELPDLGLILRAESERRRADFPEWAHQASTDDWKRLGELYLSRTKRWQKRKYFIDKFPENWRYLGAISCMLPKAKIIFCSRDPAEITWSCYKQMFAPGHLEWSYSIDTIARYLVDLERTFQYFSECRPEAYFKLTHEHLVTDFDSEVQRIANFVGLPDHTPCLDYRNARRETRTASAAQVRRTYQPNVGHVVQYGRHLDQLREILRKAGENR